MATLRQHLCRWNNDYTGLERKYYKITGAELVTDPFSSFKKGPPRITKSASVLIGTYNSKKSLEKTLISIEQSSFNRRFPQLLEVIVVDDGSTDGTRQMIDHLDVDLSIKYILQDRGGLSKAHNTGLAFVENDVIIFSDSDMVHTQYAIEELMKRHEVLEEVTLTGFRFAIDPNDPRLQRSTLRRKLHELIPEFYQDFRLNFPGRPENICRETRHWKDYGFNKQLLLADGSYYDLPTMVIGAFFSIKRADYIKMGGSDERLIGWGCKDTLIGAKSIGLGNYIIPVYAAASAHISHPPRGPNEWCEYVANLQTLSAILDEEFTICSESKILSYRSRVKDHYTKTPSGSTLRPGRRLRPLPWFGRTAADYARRGKCYYSLGLFAKALGQYEKAIELSPDSPGSYLEKGKTLRELADFANAILAFSECLRRDPQNAWGHFELGITYACVADYKKARAAFEMSRIVDPTIYDSVWVLQMSSERHRSRGSHHASQGDHKLAVRDFELALAVDETNYAAHFDRGLSLRCLGRLQEALESFQRAGEFIHLRT